MVTSFILAFSGLSIQAQVASILAETDIRFAPFFFARIIHGFIAAILAYLLWNPLYIEFSHFGNPPWIIQLVIMIRRCKPFRYMKLLLQIGPLFTIVSLILYIFILMKNKCRYLNKKRA